MPCRVRQTSRSSASAMSWLAATRSAWAAARRAGGGPAQRNAQRGPRSSRAAARGGVGSDQALAQRRSAARRARARARRSVAPVARSAASSDAPRAAVREAEARAAAAARLPPAAIAASSGTNSRRQRRPAALGQRPGHHRLQSSHALPRPARGPASRRSARRGRGNATGWRLSPRTRCLLCTILHIWTARAARARLAIRRRSVARAKSSPMRPHRTSAPPRQ